MNGIDIHQLAAAYALDAVDERERAEFEAHYPTCPVCRPEVAGFRETLSQLAAASAVAPPASLKDVVMAEVGSTRQLSPLPESVTDLAAYRRRHQRLLRSLTIAAAVVLIAVGAFAIGRQTRGGNTYATAAAAIYERADTRVAGLTGPGSGNFKVAWSPSAGRMVVTGDGLADPGPGKAYELWLIDDNGPHAVRLLDKAGGGHIRRVVNIDGAASQWAVTVESDRGADQPTGDVMFSGAA